MTAPELAPDKSDDASPEEELTEKQFSALRVCAEWQLRYGDRANWTEMPLSGIPLELCQLGYLIADDLGGVIFGLTVTSRGMRKVAH